ncbi:MAG: PIN domain-containing protein [Rhizobiales bacterium]|nr:PIN domain-containing protein [Hyphomicrobiales bacterium]
MIAPKRFTLDTNILVYSVDSRTTGKHKHASSIVTDAAERDCLLTVQTLGEFTNVAQRKDVAAIDKAIALTRAWQQVFPVVAANQETFNDAVEYVRDHQISFWDAMLWVTAKQAGCAYVLSEDMQHGRRLGGVEVINPFIKDAKPTLELLFG